jgi:hypothetical protein
MIWTFFHEKAASLSHRLRITVLYKHSLPPTPLPSQGWEKIRANRSAMTFKLKICNKPVWKKSLSGASLFVATAFLILWNWERRVFPPFFSSQEYFDKSVWLICKVFGGNKFSSSSFFTFVLLFSSVSQSFLAKIAGVPTYFLWMNKVRIKKFIMFGIFSRSWVFPWTVSRQCTPHSPSVVESYRPHYHMLSVVLWLLSHVCTVYRTLLKSVPVVDLDPK